MIPLLEQYEFVTPGSLGEALDDLAKHPAARPFAGGTDLMVVLEAGHLPPGRYVSLQNCRELLGIDDAAPGGGISIGALTTYTQMRNSTRLGADYGMLPLAARETGGIATQNRGTIGGNIANASPAADTPPALLVYDAALELMSKAATRRVPYAAFHRGYKKMDLAPGEIIARIHLPSRTDLPPEGGSYTSRDGEAAPASGLPAESSGLPAESSWLPPSGGSHRWRDYYRKVGTRRAQAISKICFAGAIVMTGDVVSDVRIALGSVAPTPIRATRTESALRGKRLDERTIAAAMKMLTSEIAPIDDIRSTARYRTRVATNLLREFLTSNP
jgi:CO/xanthine dehydrogenase FAD-binding subunit